MDNKILLSKIKPKSASKAKRNKGKLQSRKGAQCSRSVFGHDDTRLIAPLKYIYYFYYVALAGKM